MRGYQIVKLDERPSLKSSQLRTYSYEENLKLTLGKNYDSCSNNLEEEKSMNSGVKEEKWFLPTEYYLKEEIEPCKMMEQYKN